MGRWEAFWGAGLTVKLGLRVQPPSNAISRVSPSAALPASRIPSSFPLTISVVLSTSSDAIYSAYAAKLWRRNTNVGGRKLPIYALVSSDLLPHADEDVLR